MINNDYGSTAAVFGLIVMWILAISIVVLIVIGLALLANYKLFEKLNITPWYAFIPFYNTYLLCEAIFGNGLYMLGLFLNCIPGIGQIAFILYYVVFSIRLAKSFHKGTGFIFGLIFLPTVFRLILAFDDSWFAKLPDYDISRPFD